MALKTQIVTCGVNRFPKKLRWLKDTPYSIREEATKELSMAYSAAFRRLTDGTTNVFDNIKFRSVKATRPSAITIPTQNFSKRAGRRWNFYTESLPNEGRLRFHKRNVRRIIEKYPDGPPRAVKITMTKTGRFLMHAPLYVQKKEVSPQAQGHLVALDPGSNPYMTYYSPTTMVAGSFGMNDDLQKTFRPYQDRLNQISSLLDDKSNDAPYIPPSVCNRLSLRRLRIHEQMRNRTKECINKVVHHLTSNYQYIHGSIFEVANMVERPTIIVQGETRKGKGKIRARTRRDLLTWRHAAFKAALQGKAELIEGLVVELNDEAYTTKTCGFCGHLRQMGGEKKYSCQRCGYRVHRDVNGARNHALKNCVGKYVWDNA